MDRIEATKLRKVFIHYMTIESDHQDKRRKDFNQAIFDAKEGYACWANMDLDMVLGKFDKAVKEMLKEGKK